MGNPGRKRGRIIFLLQKKHVCVSSVEKVAALKCMTESGVLLLLGTKD